MTDVQPVSRKPCEQAAADNSIGLAGLLSCTLSLEADEVHIWQAALEPHHLDNLKHRLSDQEIDRSNRFHFEKDRNEFIVGRGLLRILLSAYLGVESETLSISYAQNGKPFLVDIGGLSFNLAHSNGLAVYAFSKGRELGIDLEFVRQDIEAEQIAQTFFSQAEIESLRKIPAELRNESFFNCWTRKEAYIKARGEGLSMPLDEFDVAFAPDERAALVSNRKEPNELSRWTMQSLELTEGYCGALVVEGTGWSSRPFVFR